MLIGYAPVSKAEGSAKSQPNIFSWYLADKRWSSDRWVEVEDSSRQSVEQPRITKLLAKRSSPNLVIAFEHSWLGRSLNEVPQILHTLIRQKRCRLILLKQSPNVNLADPRDMIYTILLMVFFIVTRLERDFVSKCTIRLAFSIKLDKPKGDILQSIYNKDKERVFHLHAPGVPIGTITYKHLVITNTLHSTCTWRNALRLSGNLISSLTLIIGIGKPSIYTRLFVLF